MDTKKCKKCSENIKKEAKQCRHCGTKQGLGFLKGCGLVFLVFVGFIIISAAIGGNHNENIDPSSIIVDQPKEVISISARQLYDEYIENQIAADLKYENEILEISGTVDSIGKDILDNMYVSLKTNDLIGSVQCMLEDSELEKAVNLANGQSIIVQGEVSGFLVNVILRDCTIQ